MRRRYAVVWWEYCWGILAHMWLLAKLWPWGKFHFCKRSVMFAGYILDWEEYQPIMELSMPIQPALTDVCAWFGLFNHVAPFLAVAPIMEPFWELKKSVYWDEQLQAIFSSAKDTIGHLAAEGLRYYDVLRPTATGRIHWLQLPGYWIPYYAAVYQESPLCSTQ